MKELTMSKTLKVLPDAAFEEAAECLRIMAHPVRLKMVSLLMQGQFAVHELAELCGTSPNQTCEHLRLLKGHGLLSSHRKGRTVYYGIASPRLPRLIDCIKKTCET
jgi:ArsR family transcriptional regulator, zinc-responsive transcriptional repressor